MIVASAGVAIWRGRGFCDRAQHEQGRRLDFEGQPGQGNLEEVLARFVSEKAGAEATLYSPTGIRLPQSMSINRHPFFTDGKIEVQDEGSQLLGFLVRLGAAR